MRPALVQNVTAVAVAATFGPAIPAGRRATVDIDHPVAAKAVARGRLKVLAELAAEPAEDPGFVMGDDPGDHSAAEVIAFLEALDPDAPASWGEAARIAAAERAGKARTTVLAAADELAAHQPTLPEE